MLAGLPTTRTLTSVGGAVGEGLALDGEDGAVGLEQVAALHALRAGPGADEQGDRRRRRRPRRRRRSATMPASSGKAQSSSSMATPSSAPRAGVISSSWRMTGWSGPSMRAAGDAEQQAVADLAGGSGDGDADGGLHDGSSSGAGVEAGVERSLGRGERGSHGAVKTLVRAAPDQEKPALRAGQASSRHGPAMCPPSTTNWAPVT